MATVFITHTPHLIPLGGGEGRGATSDPPALLGGLQSLSSAL